ncbi:MAG: outer membrane lipoprotein carrier protein LolA [Desulfuromonadaceae bacterium]|nr:outer membrane lipoprotein carrier protein LolA [Desulfuromonadaceae bacterium]MDD5106529.1 outer membrane lipoprotein carrier protein LolA [Desulfuromonadaceae bacterium]
MIRLHTAGVLILLLTLPLTAAAASATIKEVVTALEKGYAGLQDVQADFSQKTILTAIGREQKGSGEVLLKRPASASAMFRFNYTKPKQQIISNGKQVWFYTPENKQVLVNSVAAMFSGGNSIALTYLTGLGHVSRDFDASFSAEPQDKNGNFQLDLTPKKPSPVLTKLQLTVSSAAVSQVQSSGEVKNVFPIISSTVHDAGGNKTRIDYSRTRVNKGLSDAMFNFKIPEGVEVIKP